MRFLKQHAVTCTSALFTFYFGIASVSDVVEHAGKGRRTLYNFCCVGRCADGQQLLGVRAHYPITYNRSAHTAQQKLAQTVCTNLLKLNVARPSGF